MKCAVITNQLADERPERETSKLANHERLKTIALCWHFPKYMFYLSQVAPIMTDIMIIVQIRKGANTLKETGHNATTLTNEAL